MPKVIDLNNLEDIDTPRRIVLTLDEPDSEGWVPYHMALEATQNPPPLVAFTGSFSQQCLVNLKNGLQGLTGSNDDSEFTFEPIEPAFRFDITRWTEDILKILCIVDLSFIEGGPSTETGIGMEILVHQPQLVAMLTAL